MLSDDSVNLDEVIVGGLEPQTWYVFVQGQVELLHSHVQEREKEIGDSIKSYQKKKRSTDVEYADEGYPIVILEEYSGLEGPPSDLQDIFEYYYPNLQRRSMLIVLFSFLERQLDELCQLFAKGRQLSITQTDLKGNGIDRTRLYLQKVIGLPLGNSAIWQEIKRIQRVRNVVVHNDAKLITNDKDLIEYMDKTTELSRVTKSYYDGDIDEIDILNGYLVRVLETFNSYCGEVDKAMSGVHYQAGSRSESPSPRCLD